MMRRQYAAGYQIDGIKYFIEANQIRYRYVNESPKGGKIYFGSKAFGKICAAEKNPGNRQPQGDEKEKRDLFS